MFLFVSPLYTFCVLGKRDPFFCTFQLNSIAYKKKKSMFPDLTFLKVQLYLWQDTFILW